MSFFERLRTLPRDKTKKELDAYYEKIDLEKGDFFAMLLAGFITFVPILLGIALVLFLMLKIFNAI